VELYPSIDIRDGRCVRLLRGDYDQETVYDDDPVAVARRFVDAGARWVHVVDLDAARTGEALNRDLAAAIAAEAGEAARVQVGGGVRDEAAAAALLDAGVDRVVVGTAALEDPGFVRRLAGDRPGGVALGLDARGREVAVRGWSEGTGRDVLDVLPEFADVPVAALIVTQIAVDGTMRGPDLDGLARVLANTAIPLIASGGVGALDDLRALARLEVDGRSLSGAIVGRAIYEGAFTVEEALAAIA
jgi:phosphoribosylformimino-5-aminoimidazole carboxamide ribotide isomerase